LKRSIVIQHSFKGAIAAKLSDYNQLFKVRLNLVVVFSAVVGYILAAGTAFNLLSLLVLIVGGFLVTASANAINQVLETDYDKLMKRTKNRPLPTGRMKSSEAILAAGLSGLAGLWLLGIYFNITTAFVAALSLISYAFIYTPLKRYSPIAVFVGAVPGALPPVIGWLAFTGSLTMEPVILFVIQFFWQMPHFWAIGWLGHTEYQKAGFNLLPTKEGKDKVTAFNSIMYAIVLIPLALFGTMYGVGYRVTLIMSVVAGLLYIWPAIKLYKTCTDKAALKLMFASFLYLPLLGRVQFTKLFHLQHNGGGFE